MRAVVWTMALLTVAAGPPASGQPPGEEEADRGAPAEEAQEAGEAEGAPPAELEETIFVEGALPEVPTSNTVAAKFALPLRETPASVAVVDGELFEEQGAVTLSDALENVAGINVQTFNGIFDFFVLRGLDSVSSGLVLVDGAPEPEASFYHLYNVSRVEVLQGPSAFVYGGGSLGGAVNLVRRRPGGATLGEVGLRGGSFGTFEGEARGEVTSASGELSLRLDSTWRESDGYRDRTDHRVLALSPTLAWRPGPDTAVHLSLEHVGLDYRSDVGLPLVDGEVAGVPRTRSYSAAPDLSDQEIARFQVDVEHRLSDRLAIRDKLYLRSLDWLSRGTILGGVLPAGGGLEVQRSLLELDDEQRFVGNQLELLARLGRGRVRHHLMAGVEIARFTDEFDFSASLLPSVDLFDPVIPDDEPLFPLPGEARSADAESTVVAPYLVDQVSLGERVDLFLGLRFDTIDFEDRASGVDRRDEELSPMAGVSVGVGERTSLYANAASAFAPPSTFAVAEDQVPEESTQVEVGVKHALAGGRGRLSLALYELERENVAIPDASGVLEQTGSQEARGVEVQLDLAPAEGWRLTASYAYTDAELTEFTESVLAGFFPPTFATVDLSGNTPPFVPEHLADAWLRRRFDSGLSLAGGVRWVDEQFIAEDNAFAVDSYLTVDAAVSWVVGAWRLDLELRNLTDEEYFTRGFGKTSVIPAPGFATYGGVRYGF